MVFLLRQCLLAGRGAERVIDATTVVARTPDTATTIGDATFGVENRGVTKRKGALGYVFVDCHRVFKKLKESNLETHLLGLLRDVYSTYSKSLKNTGTAQKKDDAPVPVELWLYWLNAGVTRPLSLDEWHNHAVVLQKKVLLSRWKRNVVRSFVSWLRMRLERG